MWVCGMITKSWALLDPVSSTLLTLYVLTISCILAVKPPTPPPLSSQRRHRHTVTAPHTYRAGVQYKDGNKYVYSQRHKKSVHVHYPSNFVRQTD